jgi:hypothetical protein
MRTPRKERNKRIAIIGGGDSHLEAPFGCVENKIIVAKIFGVDTVVSEHSSLLKSGDYGFFN